MRCTAEQDPPGKVLRGGGAAAAQELHEHQGLVDVAHAHALGDVVPQALVGGGGGWGHEGILDGIPCAGRLAGAGGVNGGGTGGGRGPAAMPCPPSSPQPSLTGRLHTVSVRRLY